MSVILRPELNKGWKPVFGSGYWLDRNHPLNKDIALFVLTDFSTIDSATNLLATPSAVTYGIGDRGRFASFNGTSSIMNMANSRFSGATQATWIIRIYIRSAGSGNTVYGVFLGANVGENSAFHLQRNASANAIQAHLNGVAGTLNPSGAHNAWRTFAFIYTGSALLLYMDAIYAGVLLSYSGAIGTHSGIQIGGNSTSSLYSNSDIAWIQGWRRALSEREIIDITRNPFGNLENPRLLFPGAKKYFVAGVSGETITLDKYFVPAFIPARERLEVVGY